MEALGVAVPLMLKLISPQPMVERLKPEGKVTDTVFDAVVPLLPPSLAKLFCAVNAMVWLEVADIFGLLSGSDRLET